MYYNFNGLGRPRLRGYDERMRFRLLSVCVIALVVFFGLRLLMRSVEPHQPGSMAVLINNAGQDASRNHLLSLASIAAGAVAFAVIPARKKSRPAAKGNAGTYTNAIARCPQCDQAMRRILIAGGEHRGRTMWLCPQSPDCDVRPLARRSRDKAREIYQG